MIFFSLSTIFSLLYIFHLIKESFLLTFLCLLSLKILGLVAKQVDCFSVFLSDLACVWLGISTSLWASYSSGLSHCDTLLLSPSVPYSSRNSYSSLRLLHKLTFQTLLPLNYSSMYIFFKSILACHLEILALKLANFRIISKIKDAFISLLHFTF